MAEEKEKSEETFKVNTGDEEKTVEVEQDFDTPEDGIILIPQLVREWKEWKFLTR